MLKRWRYLGAYGPELMLCIGLARIGPGLQGFWALWDREEGRLMERTRPGRGGVRFGRGSAQVHAGQIAIELAWEEVPGIEVVTPDGDGYAWTRKQGGVLARGTVRAGGRVRELALPAVVDDSAGYHPRRTAWRWSAGVGTALDGRAVAWNLVAGVHDDPRASERTVWVEERPHELGPVLFAADLSEVAMADGDALRFAPEAIRERHDDLLLFRSDYVQPFGTFSGSLPFAGELAEGFGVMERHEVVW
jgi:uncharacterized protein DUF2804